MADKITARVKLDFPLDQVTQPIIYHLVKDFDLVPNIRRANIDHHAGGMMALEIEGDPDALDAGMKYLESLNITVTPVGEGQSWTI